MPRQRSTGAKAPEMEDFMHSLCKHFFEKKSRSKLLAVILMITFCLGTLPLSGFTAPKTAKASETDEVVITAQDMEDFQAFGRSNVRDDNGVPTVYKMSFWYDKLFPANVNDPDSGREVRYTNDLIETMRFSMKFGNKAYIGINLAGAHADLPATSAAYKFASGSTVLFGAYAAITFSGGPIYFDPGVKIRVVDISVAGYVWDIAASESLIYGKGVEYYGDMPARIRKKPTAITQAGSTALVADNITAGQKLSDAAIKASNINWTADIPGTWEFVNGDTVPEVGTHKFDVRFVPDNELAYETKTFENAGEITVVEASSGNQSGNGGSQADSGNNGGSQSGTGSGNNGGSANSGGDSNNNGNGSGSGTGNDGDSQSGTGSGNNGGSANSGGDSNNNGNGSGGGSNNNGSGSGGNGSNSGGNGTGTDGNGSGGGSGNPSGGTAPSATPDPNDDSAVSGAAIDITDDDGEEEEIIQPIVIEQIVDTISKVSTKTVGNTKATSAKRSGSKLTIKVKKVKGAKYQIQYTTKPKSWKKAKSVKFSSTKKVIRHLKKKKTYYYRVRAYKKSNGKTVYGSWSKRKRC